MNPAEDGADAIRNTRHDGAGGDGHETGHQSVFDEVLTFGVLDDAKGPEQILNGFHFLIDLLSNLRSALALHS